MLLLFWPTQRNTALWWNCRVIRHLNISLLNILYSICNNLGPVSAICKEIPLLSFVVNLFIYAHFVGIKLYLTIVLFCISVVNTWLSVHFSGQSCFSLCEMRSCLLLIFLFICWGSFIFWRYWSVGYLFLVHSFSSFFTLFMVFFDKQKFLISMWSDFLWLVLLCPASYVLLYPKVVQIISCIFF